MTARMKAPPHPGRLIKENIDELGLTVSEAATGLGVSRQQWTARRHPGNGGAPREGVWRLRGFLAAYADEFRIGASSPEPGDDKSHVAPAESRLAASPEMSVRAACANAKLLT